MRRATRDSVVAAIVLAAGRSLRFGECKALAEWRGESLIRRVAKTALESIVSEVHVVVGARGYEVARQVEHLPVRVVWNPRFADGQSTSVHAAVEEVQADAALFLAVDQPALASAVLDRLVAKWSSTGRRLIVPLVEGERRSPVLVDRSLFPSLAALAGDRGVRQLFDAHSEELLEVPFDDETPFIDVDTPEDWRRLDQRLG